MIGTTVVHYRVTAKLGEGGMGTVWKAEDTRLGRPVALKLLSDAVAADASLIRRFEAEARLASSLNHPHIVAIYDVGEAEGRRFIAMEFVEGGSLRRRMDERRLRMREVVDLGLEIAEALAAAHRTAVIHRDVKPDNVLVSRDGRVKLGDFGIAKLRQPESGTLSMAAGATAAGTILGSPHYMSPEQALGEELDQRSDVFSFAATLYEMATGRRPFEGGSVSETLRKILSAQPPAPTEIDPSVPVALEDIILKGLEKSPDLRYQHMEEVASDLRRLRRDFETGHLDSRARPAPSKPKTTVPPIVTAALVSAVLSGLVVYWLTGRRAAPAAEPAGWELLRLTALPGLEDEPSWSPDGRSLVYASDEGGHLGLWIRQASGGRAIHVGSEGVDEAQPAWSPDGSRIAFVSARNRGGRFGILFGSRALEMYVNGQNGDLYVMPALGGAASKVAENAYDPAWSPDGRSLAFRSIRDGAWRLWTVSLDDGRIEPVKGRAAGARAGLVARRPLPRLCGRGQPGLGLGRLRDPGRGGFSGPPHRGPRQRRPAARLVTGRRLHRVLLEPARTAQPLARPVPGRPHGTGRSARAAHHRGR
jgi:predicted Ser/Thr protein kinase